MSGAQHTFVFADLAGFTAMTEAHGDEAAADAATAFCRELNRLMPDGGEDLKSLGDACMVRIPDPYDAVDFGLRLTEEALVDRPFPEIRVGMHSGPAVERDGDWYGRNVNIAARVAAHALGGQVLLTAATREAASSAPSVRYDDLGPTRLRNLRMPVRILQASRSGSTSTARRRIPVDPVCRLRLPPGAAQVAAPGTPERFCSRSCAERFLSPTARVQT